MTNEQAVNMLNAKLECLKIETSGTDFCNHTNCDDCSLCYEQGNMGEQKEALDMAIKALEKQDRIAQILDDYDLPDTWEVLDDYDLLDAWEVLKMVKEVVRV